MRRGVHFLWYDLFLSFFNKIIHYIDSLLHAYSEFHDIAIIFIYEFFVYVILQNSHTVIVLYEYLYRSNHDHKLAIPKFPLVYVNTI